MSESFGSMLRSLRLARGMTQEALAHEATMSPTAVAALERGRNRAPRMSTLQQLARALVAAGTNVLWGRCSQDRLGSYLPFVEALRHVVAQADTSGLRAAVGVRGDLTRLVPELVERVGALPAPARAEAGSDQRMLF